MHTITPYKTTRIYYKDIKTNIKDKNPLDMINQSI
jgi:hypothetical protein